MIEDLDAGSKSCRGLTPDKGLICGVLLSLKVCTILGRVAADLTW